MEIFELAGAFFGVYRIVPANEAHVRILYGKKSVFTVRDKDVSAGTKGSYWIVPFVTKIHKLPLANLRIDVPDVKLNDKNMAKFSCDIVCFVNIKDPLLAAERTTITAEKINYEDRTLGLKHISEDFRAIMESVSRTVATQNTILEIYMDRTKLDNAVSKEIQNVFPGWGLNLVDLEIKDIKDIPGSTIIQDIETKIAAQINADARVKVATESQRAQIAEANAEKEAEMVKAVAEETWKKRHIEKEQVIGVAEQDKSMEIAKQQEAANKKIVDANRALTVGNATVDKEKITQLAEAEKSKLTLEGEGAGNAKRATLEGEAAGTEKLAMALQKYNDSATKIRLIEANQSIGLAMADAYGKGLSVAKINIVTGESQDLVKGGLLGNISVGGKEGIGIQQFIQGLGEEDLERFMNILGALKEKNKTDSIPTAEEKTKGK